jgi:hypothetical protein
METEAILQGLLLAYIDGDVLARKVLLDYLEEQDDARLEAVRAERVDWGALASTIAHARGAGFYLRLQHDVNKHRWLIDCARAGSEVQPYVKTAVGEARRQWLRQLFPEIDLSGQSPAS